MPTLQQLKDKWFLDVSREGQFPPQTRHPGTQLQPYTDGNLVEPVLDGAPLLAEFNQRVEAIINAPGPTQYERWIAQWRLDPVELLGETNPGNVFGPMPLTKSVGCDSFPSILEALLDCTTL
jgi:hypothetical protein